jgi:hypothetical protein
VIKMLGGLFILSIISTIIEAIKGVLEPTIPAENWANRELYRKDLMNGVSVEECMKNVRKGRYKLTETYPKPHRDSIDGKILIENYTLYKKDLFNYGAGQTMKWVEQGKYNLSKEELKKEKERIKMKYNNPCKL